MSNIAPLLSSVKQDWRTPAEVIQLVQQVGPIVLDPCASREEPVCAPTPWQFFGPGHIDGLAEPWADWACAGKSRALHWVRGAEGGRIVYVNPPYGRALPRWVEKCAREGHINGCEIVLLIPARTDTRAWQTHVRWADAVCFWRGRMTFVGAPAPAPFPSALVYWGARAERFAEVFAPHGIVEIRR